MEITEAEFEAFSDQLMRRLIHISQFKTTQSSNHDIGIMISKLLVDAAISQVASFVCTPHQHGSVHQLISTKIQKTIKASDINIGFLFIACPEMMIWIIMTRSVIGH